MEKILTPSPEISCRYNPLHFHSVPFNTGDRYKHPDRHWDSLLWWRHGSQCFHLAKGEDDGVQLHETTATSDDADASEHATPQQFDAPNAAADHRPSNTFEPELINELTAQYNS